MVFGTDTSTDGFRLETITILSNTGQVRNVHHRRLHPRRRRHPLLLIIGSTLHRKVETRDLVILRHKSEQRGGSRAITQLVKPSVVQTLTALHIIETRARLPQNARFSVLSTVRQLLL